MIYLIDPAIVNNVCPTLCVNKCACKPIYHPLYGVPTDTI